MHITGAAGCQLPTAHRLLILPIFICIPFSCDMQLYRLDFASKGADLPRLGKPLASEAAYGRFHRLSWSTLGHGTADQQVSRCSAVSVLSSSELYVMERPSRWNGLNFMCREGHHARARCTDCSFALRGKGMVCRPVLC